MTDTDTIDHPHPLARYCPCPTTASIDGDGICQCCGRPPATRLIDNLPMTHLARGDVIVAPDLSRHTVTSVELHAPMWAGYDTDTGHSVTCPWNEARASYYLIERTR